jgi:hypothetical protein
MIDHMYSYVMRLARSGTMYMTAGYDAITIFPDGQRKQCIFLSSSWVEHEWSRQLSCVTMTMTAMGDCSMWVHVEMWGH